MNNLSKRVKKAKTITYSFSPLEPNHFGTYGSSNGERYYDVELSHCQETIVTPDGKKDITVLMASCKTDTGQGGESKCPGNYRHTVCYHSLGALWHSFKNVGKLITFYETYEAAVKMQFGGKVYKIESADGPGYLWATVKVWPKGAK